MEVPREKMLQGRMPRPLRKNFQRMQANKGLKPMNINAAIQYYEGLNDVGKAGFILTLKREDQQLFLDAYEEHYYRHDPENAPKVKMSTHIFEDEKS